MRGQPHFYFMLCYVDKYARLASYKKASASFHFHHHSSPLWGNSSSIFAISSFLVSLSLMRYAWKRSLVDGLLILDGYFYN
jgi:hypothetical protein